SLQCRCRLPTSGRLSRQRRGAKRSCKECPMLDPRKLLDDLLGSKVPGTESTVRDKAGQAAQMARDNPLAAGALAAVLLGTGTGRKITGSALKIGGMAAVAGLAYKAYQNHRNGDQPGAAQTSAEPE